MLFGKLPAHGDFISRGLEADERDELDCWLSISMLDAQAAHGAAFDALYEQAPPWRFALTDSGGWKAGAIVPSIDAAGRRFPLMAGYAGLEMGEVAAAATMVEALLYRLLTESLSADAALAALQASADMVTRSDGGDVREGWWTLGGAAGDGRALFPPNRIAETRPAALARLMLTTSDT